MRPCRGPGALEAVEAELRARTRGRRGFRRIEDLTWVKTNKAQKGRAKEGGEGLLAVRGGPLPRDSTADARLGRSGRRSTAWWG